MDCRFYLLHLNKLAIFDNNFYECLIYITVGVKLGLTGNTRIINVVKCVFYFSRLSSTCILDCGKQHTYGIVCLRGQCRRCAAVNVGVLFYICLDLRIIGICEEDNRETYAIYCAAAKLKELTVKVVAKGGNGGLTCLYCFATGATRLYIPQQITASAPASFSFAIAAE